MGRIGSTAVAAVVGIALVFFSLPALGVEEGGSADKGACCLNPPDLSVPIGELEEGLFKWDFCLPLTESTCNQAGGLFNGIGSQCGAPDVCPAGACCSTEEDTQPPASPPADPGSPEEINLCRILPGCLTLPSAWCAFAGSVADALKCKFDYDYRGDYSDCRTEGVCTEELGACCPGVPNGVLKGAGDNDLLDGGCHYTTQAECLDSYSGIWNPNQTCDDYDVICSPNRGACVLENGQCVDTTPILCAGEWAPGACPQPVPTLNQWGLIAFMAVLLGVALMRLRRRKA